MKEVHCLGIAKEEELDDSLEDDGGDFGNGSKNSLKLGFVHTRTFRKVNSNELKVEIEIWF